MSLLFAATPYDPDAPEGAHTSSQYLSRKDFRVIALALVILAIVFLPVYQHMRREAEKSGCKQNLKAIYQAMSAYMELHEGLFPPAYMEGDGGAPREIKGKPFVWASLLQLGPRASFRCPAASDEETTAMLHQDAGETRDELAYGLYTALSAADPSMLESTSRTIALAETSNHGAKESYNPKPFVRPDGTEVQNDGFLIGYNDTNFQHTDESEAVTRLAFRHTSEGQFRSPKATSRHPGGIHVVYADGHIGMISPPQAFVDHRTPDLVGEWAARWDARRVRE